MRKHNKGAVTVFVTLLLIPAILVSGTGVDLSRIYAARSTTRDANQLAANTLLTNYDALLQNLYGLYAVIGDDDDLVAMVDLYVKVSLFGEDVTDAQLGEFRLFGGQESVCTAVSASAPLSNVEILRHQIEEYSKYRVPVSIVSDILDRLGNDKLQEMGANTEAAAKKLEVDEQFENTLTKFNEVIEKAEQISGKYLTDEEKAYKSVNEVMAQIQYQLNHMLSVRKEFEAEFQNAEPDYIKENDIRAHYKAISDNISAYASGGWIGYNWIPAHVDDEGNDVPGAWENPNYKYYDGLQSTINQKVEDLEGHSTDLDELVQLCQEADAAKSALAQKISELEEKLDSGNCSDELIKNMRAELEDAKNLLKYDFTDLGNQMKVKANDYIVSTSTPPLKNIDGYGTSGGHIRFEDLNNVELLSGYEIEFNVHTALSQGKTDRLKEIQNTISVYVAPQRYPTFDSVSETHKECYELIKNGDFHVKSDAELDDQEKKEKAKVTELFNLIKDLWKGLTDYDPAPGAKSYSASAEAKSWAFSTSGNGLEMDFLLGDFSLGNSDEDGISGTLKTFSNFVSADAGIAEKFSAVLSNASERILLVGYATQMFSNWSYKNTEGNAPLSLTGQAIDASNHYFYNSEWEYLLNGNLNAGSNLAKITWTILGLRFLANYASSYMVDKINKEIQTMEKAVSMIPFAGGVLRFLVRPLYVLGESVVDVSLLRTGHKIALLKTKNEEWRFALSGALVSEFEGMIKNQATEKADTGAQSSESGLLYTDYLTIFLLISNPNVLASRIGDLIALNMTTSKNSLPEKAEEEDADARAEAAKNVALFDLSKANTTFAVTTKTEVRFMFLSMPFAQQGMNGVAPPTTFPVVVTDYRGY